MPKKKSGRPKLLAIIPPWTPSAIEDLGHVPDRALAARLGISAYAVKAERKRRGIAPVGGGRKPPPGGRRTVPVSVRCTPAEVAAIDAARGDRPRERFMLEAALTRAGVLPDPPTT